MERAINETNRRRAIQMQYNKEHGITPKSVSKDVRDIIEITSRSKDLEKPAKRLSREERNKLIEQLTQEMKNAARLLEFEHAAYLRDRIKELKEGK